MTDLLLNGAMRVGGWLAQGDANSAVADAAAPAGGPASAAPTGSSAGGFAQILIFVGIFVVFYLLVLRPQQKRAKQHGAFLSDLKVGVRVVTTGGMFGKIVSLEGNEAKIEIADKVVIRILKSQIAGAEANAAEAVANTTAR
jgi:preprotein translocase subunit YajC